MHEYEKKYELGFYLLIHFQFLKFRMLLQVIIYSYVKIGYYIFKESSSKLTINIYEYAHLFFGVNFQSDAL